MILSAIMSVPPSRQRDPVEARFGHGKCNEVPEGGTERIKNQSCNAAPAGSVDL